MSRASDQKALPPPQKIEDRNCSPIKECELKYWLRPKYRRMAHIICQIGRSSRKVSVLEKMILAGMDIARLNLARETYDKHAETLRLLKKAVENVNNEYYYLLSVGIAMDTQGPMIRTGLNDVNFGNIDLRVNDTVRITTVPEYADKCNKENIFVDCPDVLTLVQAPSYIYINEYHIRLLVKEVGADALICVVEKPGRVNSYSTVRCDPEIPYDMPAFTEKDYDDLQFAASNDADFIFLSGMDHGDTIREVRRLLGSENEHIKLVAKIETQKGLDNLDNIIEACDGVVFVRKNLAKHVGWPRVALLQKIVLCHCNIAGKPVIVSTGVLESMRETFLPKTTELTDVMNSVYDGADCLMLSCETAAGIFPFSAIKALSSACSSAEWAVFNRPLFEGICKLCSFPLDRPHVTAIAACEAVQRSFAKAIVILTKTGKTAMIISKYRPRCPIFAVTRSLRAGRQMQLHRGIIPIYYKPDPIITDYMTLRLWRRLHIPVPVDDPTGKWNKTVESRANYGLQVAKKMGVVKHNNPVVIVSGFKHNADFPNSVRLLFAFTKAEMAKSQWKFKAIRERARRTSRSTTLGSHARASTGTGNNSDDGNNY